MTVNLYEFISLRLSLLVNCFFSLYCCCSLLFFFLGFRLYFRSVINQVVLREGLFRLEMYISDIIFF